MGFIRALEKKVYEANKKKWFTLPRNDQYELHHAAKRVGVRLCCPLLWVKAPAGHENDREFIAGCKAIRLFGEPFIKAHYRPGWGCWGCSHEWCAMPRIGFEDKNCDLCLYHGEKGCEHMENTGEMCVDKDGWERLDKIT